MTKENLLEKFGMQDKYDAWKRKTFPNFEDVDVILSGIYSKKGSRRSKQTDPKDPSWRGLDRYYQPEHFVRAGTYKHRILQRLSKEEGEAKLSTILGEYPRRLDGQDAGMYLRRMEYANIIERPKRGVYRLTPKGKKVLTEVEEYGYWGRNRSWPPGRI